MTSDYPLLKLLDEARVFSIIKKDDGFVLEEGCDQYFAVSMSKDELIALADEIRSFANEL